LDKSVKTKLANDIENRLDDFFGEQSAAPSADSQPSPSADQSLERLKSAVLSIDWEITDECLSDLINESEALVPQYEKDPITHALLRMLRALGRYIRKRKAQSHQDAIKRVMSVFNSLETLICDQTIDEQQKKKIVSQEILAFKLLKEQVEANRKVSAAPVQPAKKPSTPPLADTSGKSESDTFKSAISAVEKRLNAEVADLRAQLSTLQEELDSLRKG